MTKSDYFRTAIIAALAISVLCMIPQWASWISNAEISGYITFLYQVVVIFTMLFIFGKQVSLKDSTENGYTLGQGFKFVILVSLFSGVFSGILSWLFTTVVAPEMAEKALALAMDSLDQANAPEESREMAMTVTKFMLSLPGMLLMNIFSSLIFGGIVGLISSAIIQRKPQI